MKYTFILTKQCPIIAQLINYMCVTSYLKDLFYLGWKQDILMEVQDYEQWFILQT